MWEHRAEVKGEGQKGRGHWNAGWSFLCYFLPVWQPGGTAKLQSQVTWLEMLQRRARLAVWCLPPPGSSAVCRCAQPHHPAVLARAPTRSDYAKFGHLQSWTTAKLMLSDFNVGFVCLWRQLGTWAALIYSCADTLHLVTSHLVLHCFHTACLAQDDWEMLWPPCPTMVLYRPSATWQSLMQSPVPKDTAVWQAVEIHIDEMWSLVTEFYMKWLRLISAKGIGRPRDNSAWLMRLFSTYCLTKAVGSSLWKKRKNTNSTRNHDIMFTLLLLYLSL